MPTTKGDRKRSPIDAAEVAPFEQAQVDEIVKTITTTAPIEHGLPGYGWSLKKLKRWVKQVFKHEVSRNLLRNLLHANGLSWKSARSC
ncbi:MAG: winged helix-turn-helix domain-containing protein [Caldilineaceae bacterium]|nr:winged helix-turn-helix domain-containing protein [Caldilineaceae bacterium]